MIRKNSALKYLQPRIFNTFSFGTVFKLVLNNKIKGDLL